MKAIRIFLIVLLLFVLTSLATLAEEQVVVPEGELVFISNRDGIPNLYTMKVDGSNIQRITNFPDPGGLYFSLWTPQWSADGTMILYGSDDDTYSGIGLVSTNGAWLPFSEFTPEFNIFDLAWSPDGQTVALSSYYSLCLFTVTLGPNDDQPCFLDDYNSDPAWSPDSQKLAYTMGGEIFTMRRDGTGTVNLTNHPAFDSEAAWSPDGSKIVFASNRTSNWQLFVMKVDGTNVQRLTSNDANDNQPTWSPDGNFIAFTRTYSNGNSEIFVMKANGNSQTRLTDSLAYEGEPDWKPASQSNPQKVLLLSSSSGGKVAGVPFQDEDLLAYNLTTSRWSLYFDGSDVGITTDIDALGRAWDGTLVMSFNVPTTVPGLGRVDDSDLVRFVPTTLGPVTAGAFTYFARGSELGLTTDAEDIDAFYGLQRTDFSFSTSGRANVPHVIAQDEDVIDYSFYDWYESFSLKFDGSQLMLTNASEDIGGIGEDGYHTYYSTVGPFSMPGLSGTGADIFEVTTAANGQLIPTMFWDGSQFGFGSEVIDAFEIAYLTDLPVTAAAIEEIEVPEVGDEVDDDYTTPDEIVIYLPLISD